MLCTLLQNLVIGADVHSGLGAHTYVKLELTKIFSTRQFLSCFLEFCVLKSQYEHYYFLLKAICGWRLLSMLIHWNFHIENDG